MFLRLLAACAAAYLLVCPSASVAQSPAIQIAEDTTVAIRANVHIHYFTDAEVKKILQERDKSSSSLSITPVVQDDPLDAPPPDEDYTAEIVCTGFVVISDGTDQVIVTARHCTQGNEEDFFDVPIDEVTVTPVSVQFFDGDTGKVNEIARDKNADLALLKTHSTRNHAATLIRKAPPVRGEAFNILGMPDGRPFVLSTAISNDGSIETTAETDGPEFAGLWLLECASCYGGDSGAGVYDKDGQVVGVLDATAPQPAVAAIVPSYRILQLLATDVPHSSI